jgi:polyketide biosynthesis enoyl-CoA hydratase PksI
MSAPTVRIVGPGVVSVAVSTDREPHFAWSPGELAGALTAAADSRDTRVILLEGAGKYFSAGGSRQLLVGPNAQDAVPVLVAEIPRVLFDVELPLIAVAAGHALGGGFAMALCCDVILLAEESLYGANFVTLGFTPGMGSSVLLAEAVGEPRAREMLFTGRVMKGRELAHPGGPLAHAVLPRAAVRRRALEIAGEIASIPRETLVALKRLVLTRRRAAVLGAAEEERRAQISLMAMAPIRSRIAAAYGVPAGLEGE